MEFFRKRSDPPLIFGSYGTREAHLIFGHKKVEKQNFPKTPKMAIFNRPGVAGAVLQTALSLIDSVTE